ncbi:MAG: hypothetical protein AB2A00_36080 [Myxococcota bacterium]
MSYDDEDSPKKTDASGRFTEFECPECTANNPLDDGFKHGDEIRCFTCGSEFKVIGKESGAFKLKLL